MHLYRGAYVWYVAPDNTKRLVLIRDTPADPDDEAQILNLIYVSFDGSQPSIARVDNVIGSRAAGGAPYWYPAPEFNVPS